MATTFRRSRPSMSHARRNSTFWTAHTVGVHPWHLGSVKSRANSRVELSPRLHEAIGHPSSPEALGTASREALDPRDSARKCLIAIVSREKLYHTRRGFGCSHRIDSPKGS